MKKIDLNAADFSGSGFLDCAGGTIEGRKVFLSPPKISGALSPEEIPAGGLVTKGYLESVLSKVRGTSQILIHVVGAGDISAKGISLNPSAAPEVRGATAMSVAGAPVLLYGLDFTISEDGSTLSWDGYAMDGRVQEDDVLRVVYKAVVG